MNIKDVVADCAIAVDKVKTVIGTQLTEKGITVENAINLAIKVPGVKINREKFLQKELFGYFSDETIKKAIEFNPGYAGIPKEFISSMAKKVIEYETNKVSALSFAAGLPGGAAMIATIPADTAQYFGFMLRVLQKIAYLYGFEEFDLDEENIKDDTMNQLLIFLGVMLGVQGANAGVKIIAGAAAQRIMKVLPNQALTKTAIYPIVKKIAINVGLKMNKQIFANGVSKIVPVIGGVVTGGLTYATFRPSAMRLKKSFDELQICNPSSYIKESVD